MARAHKSAQPSRSENPRDEAIYAVHRRYVEVMEARLATISDDTKDNYLRVMQTLTEKLAIAGKPLSEIVGEIMAEAAPLLFQAMQR
ncbi:MAG: hypothetical protein ACREQE_04320 [Candidatus Binataceae bacterium]